MAMWEPPAIRDLSGGRLHMQHGPIDIVLRAWGVADAVAEAKSAARVRFAAILPELCSELAALRRPLYDGVDLHGAVALRMRRACLPFASVFVTPMAAVAGAVADEILAAMTAAAPLDKAFVNDGGDIAVHLAPGHSLAIGVMGHVCDGGMPQPSAGLVLRSGDTARGIATSGARGRSFSLGIADGVTVLARDAAAADVAATLIANAVDCRHHGIVRRPASSLDPDSDLGERMVTVMVPPLPRAIVMQALSAGLEQARDYQALGLIMDAALHLQGQSLTLSACVQPELEFLT
jgi:ApbE superfamily uncharacterized protein (UPF0280 family)